MDKIFSPFEVTDSHIKVGTENFVLDCVGKLSTEMGIKKITKKCAGIVKKTVVKGTGQGTGTLSLHIPYKLYLLLYGMNNKKLVQNISAYGTDSVHPTFTYTGIGKDEDGVEVLIAIPCAVVSSGQKWNFENGTEDVQEIEVAFEISPDEEGEGMYCVPATDLPSTVTKKKWLEEFDSSLIMAPVA